MDPAITNIHTRRNQPPLSLIMADVVYLIRETSDITLRNLLKQALTHSLITLKCQFLQIFAAAKESVVLIQISMIPRIVVLFL